MNPTWIITHGNHRREFFTDYHADQYGRALWLNQTPFSRYSWGAWQNRNEKSTHADAAMSSRWPERMS